jgi:phosphatidylglycerophosphatase A
MFHERARLADFGCARGGGKVAAMAESAWVRRIATWFGCGASPVAPGTVGSIGALPLHFLLRRLGPGVHFGAVIAISAVGLYCADAYAEELGEKDPQSVVIDEVIGTLIALGLVSRSGLSTKLLAFALFRLFDVWKPGPIHSVQSAEPRGLGIIADDVLAGIAAGVLARLAR